MNKYVHSTFLMACAENQRLWEENHRLQLQVQGLGWELEEAKKENR
jgi:hypothetical protein